MPCEYIILLWCGNLPMSQDTNYTRLCNLQVLLCSLPFGTPAFHLAVDLLAVQG